jgi:putative addiction module killer protein
MLEVRQTTTYSAWFGKLRDKVAKVRIDIRIRRLSLGNPGDVKPVGEGGL